MALFHLSFTPAAYYARSIVSASAVNPVDQPVFDRHIWLEIAEYLLAVLLAVGLVWLIADDLGSPLWGGLTSIRLR
jgi:hypothetical protein